jgi:RHS repeat-associated protein
MSVLKPTPALSCVCLTIAIHLLNIPAEGFYSGTTYYGSNTLSKTVMTDENAHNTCVFKDKLGRVILTRKSLNGLYVDTYNVYDDYGQLVAVLPPGSIDANGNVVYSLTFQYKYDNKNRLVQKKVPGADPQTFYYDSRDLLILTQDGNMRAENTTKYLGTIYDNLGRVTKTGFALVSPTLGVDSTLTNAQITDSLTSTLYYANKSWVAHQGAKVLKPSTTTTNRNYVWSYIERRAANNYTGNPMWTAKQHLLATGQPQRPILDTDADGVDWSINAYDGAQKPTTTVRYLHAGTMATRVNTVQDYFYDNGQRMTNLKYRYSLGTTALTAPTDILSNMVYNYKDQLTEKNIANMGSTNKYLQSVDYAYNLRGWLTSINKGFLPSAKDYPLFNALLDNSANFYFDLGTTGALTPPVNSGETSPDLFKEIIRYDNPNTAYPNNGTTPAAQRNGNISQVEWQVASREAQAYTFKYDDLDRLLEANYTDIHPADWSTKGWLGVYATDNKYKETAAYDVRGNITNLQRRGMVSLDLISDGYSLMAGSYLPTDVLAYTYGDSNRLMKVTETGFWKKGFVYTNSGAARDYDYDKNGNLVADINKGITKIEYNYLNLPQVITFTANRTITFVYDASGAKLQKITNDNGTLTTFNYVNGVEYRNNILQRIAHTEGSVSVQTNGTYMHEYVLRDHLGNTRVTFSDVGNDGVISNVQTEITQINNYYPFGMNMEGTWNGSFPTAKNKYQYNGKEMNADFGLNLSDYGARFYDASIGRWTSVDKLACFFQNESPYGFVSNNPIRYVDVQGMFRIDAYFAKRYPNLTTIIASYLPMLKDNPEIIRAFTEVTGFTKAQFVEMVTYGMGPWITPTRPEILGLDKNTPPYQDATQYEPNGFEHNLFLDGSILKDLENSIGKALVGNNENGLSSNMFVMSIMILHEAAHYAHYQTYGTGKGSHKDIRWGGTDKGFDFFSKAFGTLFTKPSQQSFVDDAFEIDQAKKYASDHYGSTTVFGLTTHGSAYDKFIWDIRRMIQQGDKKGNDPTLSPKEIKDPTQFPGPKPPCGCFR